MDVIETASGKVIWLAGFILASGCGTAQDHAYPRAHASDTFFESEEVIRFEIFVPQAGMQSLNDVARTYTPCAIRIGSTTYIDVGIHLKGGAGSFQRVDQRPSLTLNFDKFNPGQKFHGLDKVHLNNSVQDPTYLKEWICSRLFARAGVPSARAAHVTVSLNGRDLGLYVLKEGYEKTFLKRHFTDASGNLYDGGSMADVAEPLDKDSGRDPEDRSDLAGLVSACREKDLPTRLARLQAELDWDRFLSFLAMEVITWHWDGYGLKANNYRLYHDPVSSRFVFFPHGMDQMFWEARGAIRPAMRGLVARAVVSTEKGKRDYLKRVETLSLEVFDPDTLVAELEARGKLLGDKLRESDAQAAETHAGHLRNLLESVVQRGRFLREQFQSKPTFERMTSKATPGQLSPWEKPRLNTSIQPAGFARAKP